GEVVKVFCPTAQVRKFFAAGLDNPNQPEPAQEFAVSAQTEIIPWAAVAACPRHGAMSAPAVDGGGRSAHVSASPQPSARGRARSAFARPPRPHAGGGGL